MSGLLDRAATLFERRFLLNAFLPVLLLGSASAALGLASLGKLAVALSFWHSLDLVGKTLIALAILTLAWFFAGVMASQFRNLTQLYEGYLLTQIPLVGRLATALTEYHVKLRDRWQQDPDLADRVYYSYPEGPRKDFLPTALGNRLRSAEYYAHYRYGLPTTFLWPRLFYVAPEHFRRDVEEFRTDYEWLLGVSFLSTGGAFTIGFVQIVAGSVWWLFVVTFGGGCLLALLTYWAAVFAAEEYGAQLRAGVDLYRTEVLMQLRWRVPENPSEEQRAWDEVRRFHLRGEPRARPYAPYNSPSEEIRG